ncbi:MULTISPECIES: YbjQ family protein [unclassified Acinetobacter]|uniref:YbjQ family protein n=1 Tax=unclassified Acinetobacter TaxID=196816 RepID=UPI0035B773F8
MEAYIFQIIVFLCLFAIGCFFGHRTEVKHLAELEQKERRLQHIILLNSRFTVSHGAGQMISSNVVISHDYFKYVIASIQNFFGGRLTSYESVVERARREAIVRLKQKAFEQGATKILGLRLETMDIGMRHGGIVEVFAYGTAVKE